MNQAEPYGFNQTIPLDVPPGTVAPSNIGTAAALRRRPIPGLMKSAIGQENVTATALQMAMVAGAVANGGVEMTPHVMAQIRDSQGNLVKVYPPNPWLQPISAQTAATLTTFMQGVVTSGTAGRGSSRPAGTWRPRRGPPRPAPSARTRSTPPTG